MLLLRVPTLQSHTDSRNGTITGSQNDFATVTRIRAQVWPETHKDVACCVTLIRAVTPQADLRGWLAVRGYNKPPTPPASAAD